MAFRRHVDLAAEILRRVGGRCDRRRHGIALADAVHERSGFLFCEAEQAAVGILEELHGRQFRHLLQFGVADGVGKLFVLAEDDVVAVLGRDGAEGHQLFLRLRDVADKPVAHGGVREVLVHAALVAAFVEGGVGLGLARGQDGKIPDARVGNEPPAAGYGNGRYLPHILYGICFMTVVIIIVKDIGCMQSNYIVKCRIVATIFV